MATRVWAVFGVPPLFFHQRSTLRKKSRLPPRAPSEKAISGLKYPETHILHEHGLLEARLVKLRPIWRADSELSSMTASVGG